MEDSPVSLTCSSFNPYFFFKWFTKDLLTRNRSDSSLSTWLTRAWHFRHSTSSVETTTMNFSPTSCPIFVGRSVLDTWVVLCRRGTPLLITLSSQTKHLHMGKVGEFISITLVRTPESGLGRMGLKVLGSATWGFTWNAIQIWLLINKYMFASSARHMGSRQAAFL